MQVFDIKVVTCYLSKVEQKDFGTEAYIDPQNLFTCSRRVQVDKIQLPSHVYIYTIASTTLIKKTTRSS